MAAQRYVSSVSHACVLLIPRSYSLLTTYNTTMANCTSGYGNVREVKRSQRESRAARARTFTLRWKVFTMYSSTYIPMYVCMYICVYRAYATTHGLLCALYRAVIKEMLVSTSLILLIVLRCVYVCALCL